MQSILIALALTTANAFAPRARGARLANVQVFASDVVKDASAVAADALQDLPSAPKIELAAATKGSPAASAVTLEEGTYQLAFVESPEQIQTGPVTTKDVPSWTLSNDVGMSVTCMRQGACAVKVEKDGKNFLWENKGDDTGACYYGADSNSFPLRRGLILHGGIRAAAVTAEHGLYYDTDWDIAVEESADGTSKSIVFTITDSEEQRALIARPGVDPPPTAANPTIFSQSQFSLSDGVPMSFYPVTNMKYTAKITLNAGEEFVRFSMEVENPTDELALGEGWFPQTYPINEDSKIISPQRMRWKRDGWCFEDVAQLFHWPRSEFVKPLSWPMDGIFYDFPSKDGSYHAISDGTGGGCACVTRDSPSEPQFTKLWSWGKREEAGKGDSGLTVGRPKAEYYEPWASAFNFAFFQRAQFKPFSKSSFEMAVLPIASGLTNDKSDAQLRETVEEAVDAAGIQLAPTVPGLPFFTK